MSISTMSTFNPDGANRSGGLNPANQIVDRSGRFDRLQPAFKNQLKALASEFFKAYHKPLVLTDTVRTDAEQARAHAEKPNLALPAGHPNAMHPKGLAVDLEIGESKMLTPEMLAHNGLHRPALYKGETWHVEPVSTLDDDSDSDSDSPSFSRFQPMPRSVSSSRLLQRAADFKQQSRRPETTSPPRTQASTRQKETPDRVRLQQTAVEVESVFLEQILGKMRSTMVDPINPSRKQLKGYLSMADQQLARSLAAGGGIGLASRIIKDLASLNPHPHMEKRHEGNPPDPGRNGAPAGNQAV